MILLDATGGSRAPTNKTHPDKRRQMATLLDPQGSGTKGDKGGQFGGFPRPHRASQNVTKRHSSADSPRLHQTIQNDTKRYSLTEISTRADTTKHHKTPQSGGLPHPRQCKKPQKTSITPPSRIPEARMTRVPKQSTYGSKPSGRPWGGMGCLIRPRGLYGSNPENAPTSKTPKASKPLTGPVPSITIWPSP